VGCRAKCVESRVKCVGCRVEFWELKFWELGSGGFEGLGFRLGCRIQVLGNEGQKFEGWGFRNENFAGAEGNLVSSGVGASTPTWAPHPQPEEK